MELLIHGKLLINSDAFKNLVAISIASNELPIDAKEVIGNGEYIKPIIEKVDDNSMFNAIYDIAKQYSINNKINKVNLEKEKQISFESDDKTFSTVYNNDCWLAINYLVECYDKNRGEFYDEYKTILRIAIVEDKESSFKVCSIVEKDGTKSNWMILRVSLKGPTSFNDSEFLRYLTKELYKNVTTLPDDIKLVSELVDGININELYVREFNGRLVAFDPGLKKFFFNAYKERLEQIGEEEDIKHGIKQYEIKRAKD